MSVKNVHTLFYIDTKTVPTIRLLYQLNILYINRLVQNSNT